MLLTRPNGYDEPRIVAEYGGDLRRVELLDAKRAGNWKGGGKGHRISW